MLDQTREQPASAGAFFFVKPEQAGHPRRDRDDEQVFFLFDAWLGDDLVAAHAELLVTTRLKEDLNSLGGPGCFRPTLARTRRSSFMRRQTPGLILPTFWALDIRGEAGRDDLGLTRDGSLVVSQRTLDILMRHQVGRAFFRQFRPSGDGRGASVAVSPSRPSVHD